MHKVIFGLLLFISLTAGAQNAEKEKAERQNAATTLLPTADNQLMQRSLNGTWKFRLVDGGTLPTALSDWQKNDWKDKEWSDINVPGCWETQGFCTASYGKTVPERHGLYRKKFVCPKEWRQKGNRIFLRIEIRDCGDLFVDFIVTAPSGAPIHERTLPVGKCAEYASLLTNLQCDKQYNIKVERDGRVVISHKKHGEMVNSPLLLRIDRPLTTTGVHRPSTKSRWSEYILKPQVMDVSTKKTAEGKSTIVSCRWKRNGKETEYIDGEVGLTVLANGAVHIDYSISASDSVKRSFTEVGLALKMSKSLGSFLWLGRGPYASFPDKYLHNELGIWALSHDDFRFNGNRSGVRIACLADNDGNGLYVVPERNKLGVENVDGNIVLTHNLSVAGIGSKSTAPCNMLKADRMRNLTGSLLLKPVSANMETPLWLLPFKKVEAIVPEKPYYKSYGW